MELTEKEFKEATSEVWLEWRSKEGHLLQSEYETEAIDGYSFVYYFCGQRYCYKTFKTLKSKLTDLIRYYQLKQEQEHYAT